MNKKTNFFLLIFSLALQAEDSAEFLYPVAKIDEDLLLVIHQKSFDDIELLRWNKSERVAEKELNSFCLPSQVKLLPSKRACSFIDRGRIKVKDFAKRTARAIDIYEPISAISNMIWIDDENFYFVGKHAGYFSIFLCNIADHQCVISSLSNLHTTQDFLYPQKINDSLFCVTKQESGHYFICRFDWNPKVYQQGLQTTPEQNELKAVLCTKKNPICFLTMLNDKKGFFLEFLLQESTGNVLRFSCCKLESFDDLTWDIDKLFDFQLPKNLFMGAESERIYESIYPFLPIHAENFIYFTNLDLESGACRIMRYDQNLKLVEKITPNFARSSISTSHFFAPCIMDASICCGLSSSMILRNSTFLSTNQETGVIQCRLPEIKLS